MSSLLERYHKQISGILSCFDRITITGTLPGVCYAFGMATFIMSKGYRIFDYPRFVEPLRDELRANAEQLAKRNNLTIEFIRSANNFRKEERIQAILKERGEHPGLVHIFSAMETCGSFAPHYDKLTQHTELRYKEAKCLHYYFYFIDEEWGLCYLRVPTWAPFRLLFYCNGHNWLAGQLKKQAISFTQLDNTFNRMDDWSKAQSIADSFPVQSLHHALDRFAKEYCPVIHHFSNTYHWSLYQIEYATDIVFKTQKDLGPIYENLSRTAIHTVKPDHIATFLGRKLDGRFKDEIGNQFQTRIQGTCIHHHMGPASIKLYDKFGLILRIETTVNDITFFRNHRTVEHRDGTSEAKVAPLRKNIYSLPSLREILLSANYRYLDFLSDLDDPSAGMRDVENLTRSVRKNGRTYRGFNLFNQLDLDAIITLLRGEGTIRGITNSMIRRILTHLTGTQVSRLLKRMHLHGLIKKVGKSYRYYLTKSGRRVLLTALKLRQLVVIPSLAGFSI
ncbi:hypothetical protein EDC14_105522 [Hydrogenispora ethanolica]|uniref:Uncharacterized protein n=1 Tax=Hydrogenispora ethanolica TaxID=1082276 RepID=A0A4R1QRF3_HYDET|nr:MarR family transcriptional regulator [Hydrogenispora ethanolica]TCL55591.1 hypothetical protein EDC14_105522 [Hydrogenispora ethanolica]